MGRAQQAGSQPAATDPGYTLHSAARIVLTDVTVTDAEGNPIKGLESSAFQIFDNGKRQTVSSFEEHRSAPAGMKVSAAADPNTFSNDFLLHPPPVYNVMMLDTSTIGIVDQMYLDSELTHFIQSLPAGEPLAIYVHAGEFSLQLQSFTADHALLLKALHKAIPVLQHPGNTALSELDAMHQLAQYLRPLPGRKNILWFGGGSNLFVRGDPTTLPELNLRSLYDEMEAARIALYPIDVRGAIFDNSRQHMLMEDEAEATGGRAYFNRNFLADTATRVLATDEDFYTLTYAPHEFKTDNSWHKISVTVAGGKYRSSYRRGYYSDGANLAPTTDKTSRTALLAGGQTVRLPENRSEPIIFKATVVPESTDAEAPAYIQDESHVKTPRGEISYTIHYSVPASALSQRTEGASQKVDIGAGVLVFNHFGRAISRTSDKFTLTFNGDKLLNAPDANLSFVQKISLPKGEDYLYVVVWDPETRRVGTLQVPLVVEKK